MDNLQLISHLANFDKMKVTVAVEKGNSAMLYNISSVGSIEGKIIIWIEEKGEPLT